MWCYTLPLRLMLKKIFYTVILCAYDKPTWQEKAVYTFKLILTFAPIAFLLDSFNLWYKDNSQFFSFIICALLINMGVGVMFHIKMKTFDWVEFFKKNGKMWVVLIVTYALLEMLRLTAGNNLVGEGFKVMIQITTLLYPVSKALKNIYIWSEKQFPPQFIMDKIYNFEKTGDIKELFDNDKNEEK
jgi:hypothetical protein